MEWVGSVQSVSDMRAFLKMPPISRTIQCNPLLLLLRLAPIGADAVPEQQEKEIAVYDVGDWGLPLTE
jgi:hypothetical protein